MHWGIISSTGTITLGLTSMYIDELGNQTAYEYDGEGRILKTENGVSTSYTYNSLNQLTEEQQKVRSITQNTKSYEYDRRSNLIKEKEDGTIKASYEFDSTNKLVKTENEDTVTEYQYDWIGNRINKLVTTDGTTTINVDYVSDQMSAYGDIIMASDLLTGKETAFVFGNGLTSLHEQSGIAYYYKLDIRESVTGIYDSYGRSVTDIRYDEFGIMENLETAHVKGNIFSYTGHVYEESTNLYYAKARYYDPEKGRMISSDPLRDGRNWYVYCSNNPVRYVDPSGMFAIVIPAWIIYIIIGGGAGAGAYVVGNEILDSGFKASDLLGNGMSSSKPVSADLATGESPKPVPTPAPPSGKDEPKVKIPKDVARKAGKLSPEAKKGYDKAIKALENGDTRGLNDHPLSGDRSGQRAVDVKGTGKGRGAGRIIYEVDNKGHIIVKELLTDHKY